MIEYEKYLKKNGGVSPVIGVILMVAITVILAAVIGTFVLELASDQEQDVQAGLDFDENPATDVQIQLTTFQSADSIWVESDYTDVADDPSAAGTDPDEVGYTSSVDTIDISSSSEFGPDNEEQYLLTRDEDETGSGTTVTADTSETPDGQLSVVGETAENNTVIQTYSYSGGA